MGIILIFLLVLCSPPPPPLYDVDKEIGKEWSTWEYISDTTGIK